MKIGRSAWLVSIALVAAVLAPPASATSRARPRLPTPGLLDRAVARGELDRGTADLFLAYALVDHERVPDRFVSDVPWDGTLPLLRLRERVAAMDAGPRRRAIRALVGTVADPGTCGSPAPPLPNSIQSTYFYVEYDADDIGGGLSITSYTTSLDAAWNTQVNTFGWAAPPVAPTPAPGNKYHVRVEDLGTGLYGFVSPVGTHAGLVGNNPNTPWNDVD
ncbi:MAG TPA: hypothetical protein VHH92_07795, partial [Actinomycetota bacterium]|nr:hypothetical protein [Actinomycetota bacterium]